MKKIPILRIENWIFWLV